MTLRYTTYSIPGGIHPPERKSLSNGVEIRPAPVPKQLVIPLGQHIGAEAKPQVQVGDQVYRGQLIGAAQGKVSAPVHASSSGVVHAIEPRAVQHPSGLPATCVVIDTDGEDTWLPGLESPDERRVPGLGEETNTASLETEALLETLSAAGIVGLGGAGFPTALKAETSLPNNLKAADSKNLSSEQTTPKHFNSKDFTSKKEGIHTLILNAVECEPYITADDLTLRTHSRAVLIGCDWLCKISGAEQVSIGIEDNKPEAITALQAALKDYECEKQTATRFEIVVVPTKYPSGGEKQLVQLITGKEIPQGGLPASLGLLCQNVGTAYAVYEALSLNRPLTSRITTLTGEALPAATRGNYEVRLGTPVASLLNALSVNWEKVDRLVMGGPMMGFTLDTADIPIVKVTNCLIAAPFAELPAPAPEMPCIRCGHCAEVCPASLLPQQLFWYSKSQDIDALTQHNVLDCIDCGACSYVCPSQIPLVQYFRFGKGLIRQHAAETQKSDHARERFEARQARLEREQAEREAKRKARAKKAPPTKAAKPEVVPQAAASRVSDTEVKASETKTTKAKTTEVKTTYLKSPQDTAPKKASPNKAGASATAQPSAQRPEKSADALKTDYLKAEKRYKDLNRALTNMEKQAKNAPSEEKTIQLNNHKEKVATLKTQVEQLKSQWLAARSAAPQKNATTPKDGVSNTQHQPPSPTKPLNVQNEETP